MRRNFRCTFNGYVGPHNKDGIISSLIAQFQAYNSDPQVILDDNGFTLSVNIDGDLTPELVRDKLAFNYFVKTVTTSDKIKLVRRMSVPISSWVQADTVNLDRIKAIHEGDLDDWNLYPDGAQSDMTKLVLGSDKPTNSIVPPFSGVDESVDTDLLSNINEVDASITVEAYSSDFSGFSDSWPANNGLVNVTDGPPARTEPVRLRTKTTDSAIAGHSFLNENGFEESTRPTNTTSLIGTGVRIHNVKEPKDEVTIDGDAEQGRGYVPVDSVTGWFVTTSIHDNDDEQEEETDEYGL